MQQTIDDRSMKSIKGTKPGEVLEDVRKLKKEFGKAPLAVEPVSPKKRKLITPEERKELELRLHRLLVWVGVVTPEEFEMGGKKLPLHDIVWDLLAKECLTEADKENVRKLIWKLTAHVRADEDILHRKELTRDEAKEIFQEAAGLMRAIASLKSVVGEKDYCTIRHSTNRRKVDDARYWLNFLEQIS